MGKRTWLIVISPLLFGFQPGALCQTRPISSDLQIDNEGCYETQGLNVMAFEDFYSTFSHTFDSR